MLLFLHRNLHQPYFMFPIKASTGAAETLDFDQYRWLLFSSSSSEIQFWQTKEKKICAGSQCQCIVVLESRPKRKEKMQCIIVLNNLRKDPKHRQLALAAASGWRWRSGEPVRVPIILCFLFGCSSERVRVLLLNPRCKEKIEDTLRRSEDYDMYREGQETNPLT